MSRFWKIHAIFSGIHFKIIQNLTPIIVVSRRCHFRVNPSQRFSNPDLGKGFVQNNVAIFWDLDNKPPISVSPFDAAVRLKKMAASFGIVRYMVACANQCSFNYVPPDVRQKRNDRIVLNRLENRGVLRPDEPYVCCICGRKFYNNKKFVNHFRQIHEREHEKRVNQIISARGSKRVKLVGKYSMKMEKYKNAARDVFTPKVGYGLGDELKRAGFWVRRVSDKSQAADIALKDHMVDVMDKRRAECVILVSDDSDFLEVLEEARLRCLKTVVVGDIDDGALKRVSGVSFSWKEIILGQAMKDKVSAAGRWKNHESLKTLEWTCNPESDRKPYGSSDEDSDFEGYLCGQDEDDDDMDDKIPWWKLESDTNVATSK